MPSRLSLHDLWPENLLRQALRSKQDWKPFPPSSERDGWMAIPDGRRKAIINLAESAVLMPWPHVPASVYLQFSQNGNRTNYEDTHFGRRKILCDLIMGECCDGNGKYLPAILDALWSICEESSWCLPAHIGAQKAGAGLPDTEEPIVDLFASETGALLAWMLYLMGERLDDLSPLVSARVKREIYQRILEPALQRDDFGWLGFFQRPVNNWNPWINSNWLACALLVEEDEEKRIAAVKKIVRSLDIFIADYPEDGGCDEGPNYWGRAGASLFDCLELLYSASDGKLNAYLEPLIQNIGQYIYRAHIAGSYFLNFADASAVVDPDASLVMRFGERIGDPSMASFGAWLVKHNEGGQGHSSGRSSSPGRELPAVFTTLQMERTEGKAPLLRDVWLPGIQVMAARDNEGSAQGLYLAAKGGHNAESHNHNDIGHFVVYTDGKPLIIDAGVETYTRKTFSPQRYEIWTMQSAYHSLPTINGIQQAPGRDYAARDARYQPGEERVEFTLDIAKAYPEEAGVLSWKRKIELFRNQQVLLTDAYELREKPASLTLTLMTASVLSLNNPGLVHLGSRELPDNRMSGSGDIHYDSDLFDLGIEEVAITDVRMGPVWGKSIYRLVFTARDPGKDGRWELSIA